MPGASRRSVLDRSPSLPKHPPERTERARLRVVLRREPLSHVAVSWSSSTPSVAFSGCCVSRAVLLGGVEYFVSRLLSLCSSLEPYRESARARRASPVPLL